jgi:hypothetical protein
MPFSQFLKFSMFQKLTLSVKIYPFSWKIQGILSVHPIPSRYDTPQNTQQGNNALVRQ